MLAKPRADLKPNTAEYERQPLIKATGFREYDARWQFEKEINLYGIQALGMGLGTLLHQKGIKPHIVVAHDFRSYSASIKNTLISGLMAAGFTVHDIGMAVSPMAYFAQFELDIPAVAMVTASHNDNGWTGVKMGCDRPLTFGPDEMSALKEIVLGGKWVKRSGGALVHVENMAERYIANLTKGKKIERPLKVVCACGNGTAGAFSPQVLRAIGCEVVELDCELDHSFPNYNPNPEALKMLHAMAAKVKEVGADVGLGFDGDGDRCGVVDNLGNEIFADKIGVMIARDISAALPGSTFVADVKSTSLFATDPVLLKNGAKADFYKTGHSYIKARTTELDAVAGFEKSGHFFFRAPYGLGYDDGLVSAIMVCEMLDHAPEKTMADLYSDLPKTWGSPTMSPYCADEEKYGVVDKIVAYFQKLADDGGQIAGQGIREVITVNGIRIVLEDGTWGLVRASSNTPNLVVVVESPTSKENMKTMFAAIDGHLKNYSEIGEYDQKI